MYHQKKYSFFTTNELKPTGWLTKQLRIQADGLCGNLDKVWPDVRDSAWIGGTCEGWERVPYWLDGFIPLAYLLEDEDMIARAKKYIDAIISFQNDDGWICPCSQDNRANYDTWAVLLITKVLALYADCSNDERIPEVILKCLKQFSKHINGNTLRNWGAARWFEGLIAIYWLYERTHEDWLLALVQKLKLQGFDWRVLFETETLDACSEGWDYYSHIVNIAMMMKSEALTSLITGKNPEEFADLAWEYLTERHGTAIGHFNGDENLSGTSPIQGAELCSIVELMFSYEYLFAISGNPKWLDRLEELAYNSLPATISPDMWSHQYDQMVNQVACFPMSKQPFRSNGKNAHTFGLEPNFGCCTANFGQGWPKFALTTFMKSETGIASCALAPAAIKTEINDVPVTCELMTEYPFRNLLTYKITTDAPVDFTFSIRIPGFASSAMADGRPVTCGTFHHLRRTWNGCSTIQVALAFDTKVITRPEDMVCVRRGPLFYSIPIAEKWEPVEYTANGVERKLPYCDYYIYPMSKWNYGLAGTDFTVCEHTYDIPFWQSKPPVSIKAKVAEIDWGFNNGHCDRLPASRVPVGDVHEVSMIPYGCTNLRITEMPVI